MRVGELMCTKVMVLFPEMTVKEAGEVFKGADLAGAPVVRRDGGLAGVMTAGLLLRLCLEGLDGRRIADVMQTDFFVLQESDSMDELSEEKQIYRHPFFPVVDGGRKLVGTVAQADLLMVLSEQALFLADEMRGILNSAPCGVVAVDAGGRVILYNTAATAKNGVSPGAALGRHVGDVVPDTGLIRVLETGVAEYNRQLRLGDVTVITNRLPIMKCNKIVGAVAVFQDITDVQMIASELETVKKLKSTLETAVESLLEGIVVVNKDGVIELMNQSYCTFLGYKDMKEVVNRHVSEVIPNTRMHLVARTGEIESGAVQRIGDHNVVVTRIPIIEDGAVVGAVGKVIFKDIKELKILYSRIHKMHFELEYYREELRKAQGGDHTVQNIVGECEKMKFLKNVVTKIAQSDSTALILGESGTGKELFAHALHNAGSRAKGPFIKVNCAAIPEALLEAELFGYEEGAFTGARKGGKPGKFELADRGTIFLDEIGDMSLIMQAKLLRVLQEKEIERVGGVRTCNLDVRVIAATHCNLEEMIRTGKFRQDLYYRLNIVTLDLPPLRERRSDIPLLCEKLLKKIGRRMQKWVEGIAPEVMMLFMRYHWPGNVRELENILERAVNWLGEDQVITLEHLPPQFRNLPSGDTPPPEKKAAPAELTEIKHQAEKEAILYALESCGGNRSKAAKLLGINRSGFYQKLHKYELLKS